MSAFDRQRRTVLNILGKTFIKVIGVGSAKFGNEAHFVSFAAIVVSSLYQKWDRGLEFPHQKHCDCQYKNVWQQAG
jgi:hypothetical protein